MSHPFLVFNVDEGGPLCGYRMPDGTRCNLPPSASVHLAYVDLEKPGTKVVEGAKRIKCPYAPDGQRVNVLPTLPYATIEQHFMDDLIAGKANGRPCPASLMRYPLTTAEKAALDREREEHRKRWFDAVNADPTALDADAAVTEIYEFVEGQIGTLHQRCHTMHGPNDPCPMQQSRPIRGPHRMGREPNPRSSAWALGGRADEDVIPSGEQTTGAIPPGVAGYSKGDIVSIDETAGRINAAGIRASEAIAKVAEAEDSIREALGIIASVAGENPGETLANYMRHLRNAEAKMVEAGGELNMGMEDGNQYIQRLYS